MGSGSETSDAQHAAAVPATAPRGTTPSRTDNFVNPWLQRIGVINNAAFRALMTLPPPQRDAVVAELTQRFGNAFVMQGLTGTLPEPPAPPTKTAAPAATPALGESVSDVPAPSPRVELRLDKSTDAERLHQLMARHDEAGIVQLLEANAAPEHMYALMRAYGGALSTDVRRAVTNKSMRARALVYLGEQLPLEDRVREHSHGDAAGILRDLDRLDDAHALALVEGDGNVVASEGRPRWVSATTSFRELQSALHDQLGNDDYHHAMRELLAKADRAQAARRSVDVPTGAIVLDIERSPIPVVGAPSLAPASQARVDLAEERIRSADGSGDWMLQPALASTAYLALADLKKSEREELVAALGAKPLKNLGAVNLLRLARIPDDATVIAQAIVEAQALSMITRTGSNVEGTDVALGRAGELLQRARAKVEGLPKDAPAAERNAAAKELARLEKLFLADDSPVRQSLANEHKVVGNDADGEQLASRLGTLGADPIAIGAERLRGVTDGESLGRALRRIPSEARLAALEHSGLFSQRERWERLTPAERGYITGLVWEHGGAPHIVLEPPMADHPGTKPKEADPVASGPQPAAGPSQIPSEITPQLVGAAAFDPTREIALHDVVAALESADADRAFALLARMPFLQQKGIYDDPRYRVAYAKLPESFLKEQLRKSSIIGAEAVLSEHANLATARDHGDTALEALGQRTTNYGGQAAMRRAYVMVERLGGAEAVKKNPALIDSLSPTIDERVAIGRLVDVTHKNKSVDPSMLDARDSLATAADRETANQIMFGQPQLADSPEAALDPDVEAEFMFHRLREASGVRSGPELMDHFTSEGPKMDAAVAEFLVMYRQLRPGGFSRKDLPLLAERYHRALRSLEAYRVANDSFAATAAQVVGAVVGTVAVTILSGGTLGPVAMAAVAGLGGGAASAATGAAIRLENTHATFARDFGVGAVEGSVAALAAPLAARVVRGATAGLSAVRGAAQAGETAVAHATGGLGAGIATAAIEGGFGNAAAELFQTAADEATWDRGIAEALATILAAVARGAVVGAGIGGATVVGLAGVAAVSRLATHLGEATAQKLTRWFDGSGAGTRVLEHLTEAEERQLGEVYHLISSNRLDEAEQALAKINTLPGQTQRMLMESARARVAFETVTELGPVDFEGMALHPRVVGDKEFERLAHGRGDAALLIENGQPHIVIRKGAPPSAIREELTHLHQWQTDLTMRERMASLSEEKLAHWDKVTPQEKLGLHVNKLEVEADGQRRIIDQLAGSEASTAALQIQDAEENLFLLNERLAELRAAKQAGKIDPHSLKLDEPPRLYAKSATSPVKKPRTKQFAEAEALVGKNVKHGTTRAELERLGYRLHERDGEGLVFRITRAPDEMNQLPHLSVDELTGTIKPGVAGGYQERAAAAGAAWDADRAALQRLDNRLATSAGKMGDEELALAHATIQASGPNFRVVLQSRLGKGGMDKASAGMLARWGRPMEDLAVKAQASGQRMTFQSLADEMLAGIEMPLTEAGYDLFRHRVRAKTVEVLHGIEDGAERMKMLHEMIAVQPDSGSRGHLFSAFREEDMTANSLMALESGTPKAFTGSDLGKVRTPDGAGTVNAAQSKATGLPKGRNALEDKTGAGAFNMEQAEDYAKRAKAGAGFRLTKAGKTTEYDNVVYVFSNRDDARAAYTRLDDATDIDGLLDRNPGGFHVMFYDEEGNLQRASKPGGAR